MTMMMIEIGDDDDNVYDNDFNEDLLNKRG